MQENFNLKDVYLLLQSKMKFIISFVIGSIICAVVVLFFVPKEYKATAVVIAGNPALADKARLTSNNIEGLYSVYGGEDDLDRIYGLALLDTVLLNLVEEFKLVKYYKIKTSTPTGEKQKALKKFKKENIELLKTEQNQLKISVWMKNADTAKLIVNRWVDIVTKAQQTEIKNQYQLAEKKLLAQIENLQEKHQVILDSIATAENLSVVQLYESKRAAILDQVKEFQAAAEKFKLGFEATPSLVFVQQEAIAKVKADRPDKLVTLLVVSFASFFFAIFILFFTKRK
jgi:tetratricopeptide (TPR) repeat protein